MSRPLLSALAALSALALACQRAPRPILAGTDECAYCRMTVSDLRFAAELQSKAGKIHTFDSIECLASFYLDARERQDVRGVWVTDYVSGGMLPAESAAYLVDSDIQSPMGRSIVALAPAPEGRAAMVARHGGAWRSWDDITGALRDRRLLPGADTARRAAGANR